MKPKPDAVVPAVLLAALCAVPWAAPAQEVNVEQDLFAVITLRGKPCGKVVSVQKLAENDYLAVCEGGQRYRVFVNADGRVVVEDR